MEEVLSLWPLSRQVKKVIQRWNEPSKDAKGIAEARGNPKQAKFRMEDPVPSA